MRRCCSPGAGAASRASLCRSPAARRRAGLAAFMGYALVVWAMTRAGIGEVAALRESSVLFAAVIGVFALGEPFRGARAAATLLILAGVAAIKFA